jgi:hypothetical protein
MKQLHQAHLRQILERTSNLAKAAQAPELTSPPFIESAKELGGVVTLRPDARREAELSRGAKLLGGQVYRSNKWA